MNKRRYYLLSLAATFIATSAVLYVIHYLIFRDANHIFLYGLSDLAFLPLEALIVGVVLERIIENNEKQEKLQKLNMVVGSFYSELGNFLLGYLIDGFDNKAEISRALNISGKWTKDDFRKATGFIRGLKIKSNAKKVDLEGLKVFLQGKREFLLQMLANPGLLENDNFTDVLWAVTHVDEELEARQSLTGLPETDMEHLSGDLARAYGRLAAEWLEYVEHLKEVYPYLFSLVVRTHPFQENRSAVVRQ
jgi:hypothetical protein